MLRWHCEFSRLGCLSHKVNIREQKEALMRAQSAFMGTDEVTTQGDDDETIR